MARRVAYYEKPTVGEVLGTLLALVIFFIVFLILGATLNWIVFYVFLGIVAAAGLIYALIVYIKALVRVIKSMSGYCPRCRGTFFRFLEKIFVASAKAAYESLTDNLSTASNAVTKSRAYKNLSFRKWAWLVCALSVLIFGICLIAAVIFLEFAILHAIILLIAALVFVFCAIYFLIGLFYALYPSAKISFVSLGKNLDFSCFRFRRDAKFAEIDNAPSVYFPSLGRVIAQMWRDWLSLSISNVSLAMARPVLSLSKWFWLVSPAPLFLWTAIFTILFAVLLTVLFFLIVIALFLWTCLMRFVSLFRRR